ncbi:MAG: 4'-phosphopantetheinyl transferase superfamily protein [Deltaproteobacteria bacterium]|nr:4'-phosphopantetheinyl transferase superfamily protein [Deltaproteobacteria bacterium]
MQLRQGEIAIYQVWLDAPPLSHPGHRASEAYEAYEGWLSAAERVRFERFRVEKPRAAFLLGRATLRSVLGQHLNVDGRRIELKENDYGRPELAAPETNLFFNLSHTSGLLALAVSRDHEVGIDVEYCARSTDTDAIAEHVFAVEELMELRTFKDPAARRRHFFKLWTLKEAYIKARGMGLALPLKDMAFIRGTSHMTTCPTESGRAGSPDETEDPFTFDFRFQAAGHVDPRPDAWCFGLHAPDALHQMAFAAWHTEAVRRAGHVRPKIRLLSRYWPPPPTDGDSDGDGDGDGRA